jgi:hypothetical protein
MSAAARLVVPARTSSSKMGSPVSLDNIVPGKDRVHYKHRLYWTRSQTRSADQYNSIVVIYKQPCLRRWLDFVGGRIPKGVNYASFTPNYKPDSIKPRPMRYWTLIRDGEPFACYTNCVECWLLVLSGELFGSKHKWSMLYTDRAGI